MQRPRNKQPRPQQQQGNRPPRNNGPRPPRGPRPGGSNVPNTSQVVPGAGVSIVLKEDQPTGNETQGVVQDVLTKGNHPRGIKVRLRDGQVGRVQRMTGGGEGGGGGATSTSTTTSTASTATTPARNAPSGGRFTMKYTDVRNDDEFLDGPPPRSLADFFPEDPTPAPIAEETGGPIAKCPVCECFEGDEVAVSYHVEKEHLA